MTTKQGVFDTIESQYEYRVVPKNHNYTNHSDAKLHFVMWCYLTNHIVTLWSFGQSWAYFVFAAFLFFWVSSDNFLGKSLGCTTVVPLLVATLYKGHLL